MNEFYDFTQSSTYKSLPGTVWTNAYSEGMLFNCTLGQENITVGPAGPAGFSYSGYVNFAWNLQTDLWLSSFPLQNVGGYLGIGQIPNLIPFIKPYINSFMNATA